jgi:hypothetical protein
MAVTLSSNVPDVAGTAMGRGIVAGAKGGRRRCGRVGVMDLERPLIGFTTPAAFLVALLPEEERAPERA